MRNGTLLVRSSEEPATLRDETWVLRHEIGDLEEAQSRAQTHIARAAPMAFTNLSMSAREMSGRENKTRGRKNIEKLARRTSW